MSLIKCNNGHYYDRDKSDQCPYCRPSITTVIGEAFEAHAREMEGLLYENYIKYKQNIALLKDAISNDQASEEELEYYIRILLSYVSHLTYQSMLYGRAPEFPFILDFERVNILLEYFKKLNLSGYNTDIKFKAISDTKMYIRNAKALKFFYSSGERYSHDEYTLEKDFKDGKVVYLPLGKGNNFLFHDSYSFDTPFMYSIFIRVGQNDYETALMELVYTNNTDGSLSVILYALHEEAKICMFDFSYSDSFIVKNLDDIFNNINLKNEVFSIYIADFTEAIIGNTGTSLGLYIQRISY